MIWFIIDFDKKKRTIKCIWAIFHLNTEPFEGYHNANITINKNFIFLTSITVIFFICLFPLFATLFKSETKIRIEIGEIYFLFVG